MPIANPSTFPEKIGEVIIDCPCCGTKLRVDLYGIKNYPIKRPKPEPSKLRNIIPIPKTEGISSLELTCPYCQFKAYHTVQEHSAQGGESKWKCKKCERIFG